MRRTKILQSWFIDVAQGRNVSAINHSVPLTKRSTSFYKSTFKTDFIAAIRYGQVKAIGGKYKFCK
jgi:hypothetical protein